jgi:hypothetical protein
MKRADFMSPAQAAGMRKIPTAPRSHAVCVVLTGVARPGKTAHDKARKVWSTAHSRHGGSKRNDS